MTTHKADCKMSFGRKDPTCPRCQELLRGAAPRKGWGAGRRERDAAFLRALKAHDCKMAGCGPICTFGDW